MNTFHSLFLTCSLLAGTTQAGMLHYASSALVPYDDFCNVINNLSQYPDTWVVPVIDKNGKVYDIDERKAIALNSRDENQLTPLQVALEHAFALRLASENDPSEIIRKISARKEQEQYMKFNVLLQNHADPNTRYVTEYESTETQKDVTILQRATQLEYEPFMQSLFDHGACDANIPGSSKTVFDLLTEIKGKNSKDKGLRCQNLFK